MHVLMVIVSIFLLMIETPVQAHEVRPGYLQVQQTGEETFKVLWKVPARGGLKLGIYVRFPDTCTTASEKISTKSGGAFISRWTVDCPGGLSGKTIFIDGLSGTLTDVLAQIERLDGTTQVSRITSDTPSFVVDETPKWHQVAFIYLGLGVEHILLGIDHLLFVLVLLLLINSWRMLVATVTAFTVAHSLTLAAATLGYVHVPQRPVEAVIALSIAFVAAEIVHIESGNTRWTQRWPWTIAFAFGLLHGFGFAGALSEIGLPEQSIPLSLLFFNVGVEIGQLLFIACVLAVGLIVKRFVVSMPTLAPKLLAYVIGAVAAFWTIERVAGF